MFEYDAKKLEKFCIYQLMSFKISQMVSFKQFVEKSCFFMKYIVKRKEKKSVCQYKNVKSDQRINQGMTNLINLVKNQSYLH